MENLLLENLLHALSYGAMVAVIGLLIVFTGLIILIAMIYLMAAVFKAFKGWKENRAKTAAPVQAAPAAAPAPVAEPVVEETVEDDAELIAVIAAAIAAFDNSGKQLVVRKVRRVSGWNKSSREEQLCRF